MRRLLLVLLGTAVASCGCGPQFAWPNMSHPGTTQIQRLRAERFDPFPEAVSRSEMTGVRPRDYDRPAEKVYLPLIGR